MLSFKEFYLLKYPKNYRKSQSINKSFFSLRLHVVLEFAMIEFRTKFAKMEKNAYKRHGFRCHSNFRTP